MPPFHLQNVMYELMQITVAQQHLMLSIHNRNCPSWRSAKRSHSIKACLLLNLKCVAVLRADCVCLPRTFYYCQTQLQYHSPPQRSLWIISRLSNEYWSQEWFRWVDREGGHDQATGYTSSVLILMCRWLQVHELVCEFKRESVTVWGSAVNGVCKKTYARNPCIPLFFSAARLSMVYLLLCLGLLPFWPLKESCFEFCSPSVTLERYLQQSSWLYSAVWRIVCARRAGVRYSQLPIPVRFLLRFEVYDFWFLRLHFCFELMCFLSDLFSTVLFAFTFKEEE